MKVRAALSGTNKRFECPAVWEETVDFLLVSPGLRRFQASLPKFLASSILRLGTIECYCKSGRHTLLFGICPRLAIKHRQLIFGFKARLSIRHA